MSRQWYNSDMEDGMRITLRLSRDLAERLKRLADTEKRSVNGQVVYLIEKAVKVLPDAEPPKGRD